MMTLTQAVSRVASRLNKNANDTTVSTRIKNHINDVCLEKWNAYAWSFRFREYPLVLSARVTSGTVTATNGSQTVTASGTPFNTSLHEGAWIRFTGDTLDQWYRVQTVNSTSSLTIEPAYQGTTGSGKSYELSKTDYLVPTELQDIGSLKVMHGRHNLPMQHQLMSDNCDVPPASTGTPISATLFKQEVLASTYTTGTLSGTLNTTTITGVGTAWLTNVTEGDCLEISGDSNVYTVYKVNSDTSISLYNKLVSTATGASYTITRRFGKIVRISPAPDNPYVCFLKGLRAYTPLVNNADTNEMLSRYPHAVIEGAIWREAGSSPDPREDSLYQKSELMWARAQSEDEAILPQHNYNPIWNPRGY